MREVENSVCPVSATVKDWSNALGCLKIKGGPEANKAILALEQGIRHVVNEKTKELLYDLLHEGENPTEEVPVFKEIALPPETIPACAKPSKLSKPKSFNKLDLSLFAGLCFLILTSVTFVVA